MTTALASPQRHGNVVVLLDNEDREDAGDLMFAADFASAEKIKLARHARGLICLTPGAQARRLNLPPMAPANADPMNLSCDLDECIHVGGE